MHLSLREAVTQKQLARGMPMRGTQGWRMVALFPVLVGGACGGDEHEGYVREATAAPPRAGQRAARPASPPPPRPLTAADSAQVRTRVAAESAAVAAVAAAFLEVPRLKAREVGELRLDTNARQVAGAQSLGVRVSGQAEIDRMVQQGRRVPLGDSTQYWILRGMDSAPYVTPDMKAMLEELGRRFHARLHRAGLPRYRFKVTSAIRTEAQVDLRRTNSYAASTTSAHQYGTTVDVSHERFAVPAGPRAGTAPWRRHPRVGGKWRRRCWRRWARSTQRRCRPSWAARWPSCAPPAPCT